MKKILKKIFIILFGFLILTPGISFGYGDNYALTLIRPKANLWSGNDRIYKAYPGIEYNIRVAAIGGEYPYTYTLSNEPSGMSIDEDTGEITWSSPSSSASNITVRVTDQDGDYVEGTWSIDVTTTGFKFVDDTSSDNTGDGSIGNPWRTLTYAITEALPGDILYFREGEYDVDATAQDNWIGRADVGSPRIWLGYPNETATLDLEFGNRIGIAVSVYLDNLTFINAATWMFYVSSTPDNMVFRRLTLRNVDCTQPNSCSGYNPGFFRFEKNIAGSHWVWQNCSFIDGGTGGEVKGMSMYWIDDSLIEDCIFDDISHHVIAMKERVRRLTVRGNSFFQTGSRYGAAISGVMNSANGERTSGEICFNYMKEGTAGGYRIDIPGDDYTPPENLYFYRNTIYGDVRIRYLTTDDGPYYFHNNVIVNDEDSGDGISDDHILNYHEGSPYTAYSTRVVQADNLVGFPADNIIDLDTGYLTQEYSVFIGSRGWEIEEETGGTCIIW